MLYNSKIFHLHKCSDDYAIAADNNEHESENRGVMTEWCRLNQLTISKTKELAVDFKKLKSPKTSVSIKGSGFSTGLQVLGSAPDQQAGLG